MKAAIVSLWQFVEFVFLRAYVNLRNQLGRCGNCGRTYSGWSCGCNGVVAGGVSKWAHYETPSYKRKAVTVFALNDSETKPESKEGGDSSERASVPGFFVSVVMLGDVRHALRNHWAGWHGWRRGELLDALAHGGGRGVAWSVAVQS